MPHSKLLHSLSPLFLGAALSLAAACDDSEEPNGQGPDTDTPSCPHPGPWYQDADGDGYGDPDTAQDACQPPSGTVDNGDDCNDGNKHVNPEAVEACNEMDDDCDDEIDEEGAEGEFLWYLDSDGDGYGYEEVTIEACAPPSGYADNAADCHDGDAEIHPQAAET